MLAIAFPSSKEFGEFALNCLAVAGGFAVGYVLGALLAFSLDTYAFNKKSPEVLKKSIRVLSAIALALLIAFLVFRGGSGGGWGGGNGPDAPGSNTPGSDPGKKPDSASPVEPKPTPKNETSKNSHSDYEIVRVTYLGGDDVQEDRFYRVDGSEPLNFKLLMAAILKRKEDAKLPLKLEREFSIDPAKRISKDSRNVRQVEDWAETQGIKTP